MKYIFLDSNQYRHLFSRSEGFSDEVLQLLVKLINTQNIKLLLPSQTKEEVERNRYRSWPESSIKNSENKIKRLEDLLTKTEKELSNYKSFKKLRTEIEKEIVKEKKDKEKIYKTFTSNRSKQNNKLRILFQKANLIKEEEIIIRKAEIRFKKGNPPYDGVDFGDALIWESLLEYLPSGSDLIFVAHDNDAWGKEGFDPWLGKEYKEKKKGKVFFSNKLSDIEELTSEEQEKIRKEELENLKQNAVSDFINSPSFVEAGERAQRLLIYKDLLTSDDFMEILKASSSNHEIYMSFFTASPLRDLVSGNDGYVDSKIEPLSADLWRKFADFYGIKLKRQSDEEISKGKGGES